MYAKKWIDFEDLKTLWMKDEEFKKEYKKLSSETDQWEFVDDAALHAYMMAIMKVKLD